MDNPNKTRAFLAIFDKAEHGYGVGCELLDNDQNEVYHIFSLYLPRADFTSQWDVVRHVIPLILAEVPANHDRVTFYSTLRQFCRSGQLIREHSRYAEGKELEFKNIPRIRKAPISLAIGAVKRQESITERL